MKHYVLWFGVPKKLLSDNGPCYISELFKEACKLLKAKKVLTSPYRPQTDGCIEKYHSTLVFTIILKIFSKGNYWDELLAFALFNYNTSLQVSIQATPFFMTFGRQVHFVKPAAYRSMIACIYISSLMGGLGTTFKNIILLAAFFQPAWCRRSDQLRHLKPSAVSSFTHLLL